MDNMMNALDNIPHVEEIFFDHQQSIEEYKLEEDGMDSANLKFEDMEEGANNINQYSDFSVNDNFK